jgi:hypothetical protein
VNFERRSNIAAAEGHGSDLPKCSSSPEFPLPVNFFFQHGQVYGSSYNMHVWVFDP